MRRAEKVSPILFNFENFFNENLALGRKTWEATSFEDFQLLLNARFTRSIHQTELHLFSFLDGLTRQRQIQELKNRLNVFL